MSLHLARGVMISAIPANRYPVRQIGSPALTSTCGMTRRLATVCGEFRCKNTRCSPSHAGRGPQENGEGAIRPDRRDEPQPCSRTTRFISPLSRIGPRPQW